MLRGIEIRFKDSSRRIDINVPNFCPHCGLTLKPDVIYARSLSNWGVPVDSFIPIGIFCQCTDNECEQYFALEYRGLKTDYSIDLENDPVNYNYLPPIQDNLPVQMKDISPTFTNVYRQALNAEQLGLDQISGVGYRKSLEFLIKDYAISKFPGQKQNIEKNFLGKVIAENLSDFPKIQKLAKAANWIGTDATHFVQKYNGSDLNSMKLFIQSSAQFIAADFEADHAQNFIDSNV